ncbi:MAG: hypothetical protein LBU64_13015 [Planctomycetota bacterium]|nr:hypothetical protein [Planctomycetota bacterium]
MDQRQALEKSRRAMTRVTQRAERNRRVNRIKKNIFISLGVMAAAVVVALLTPLGPEYYYNTLQKNKMNGGAIASGYISGLYRLGMFYLYTLRGENALNCFDEIGVLYYGFSFSEFAGNPEKSFDKRTRALADIGKNAGYYGPPFVIPEEELIYVGRSLVRVGESYLKAQKRFTGRLYKFLYINDFQENNPEACDPGDREAVASHVAMNPGIR